jgi:putative ABC transport system substrate-binding protein
VNRAVVIVILACSLLGAQLTATPPSNKVHRIGFLWNASPALTGHLLEAFREGLHERGYIEGTHFVLEHRYAEGRPERLPMLATELVGLNVAVIVTSGTVAAKPTR